MEKNKIDNVSIFKYVESVTPDVKGPIFKINNQYFIRDTITNKDIELSNFDDVSGNFDLKKLENQSVAAIGIFTLGKFHIRALLAS